MEEENGTSIFPDGAYLMTEEPIPGWTPDMIRQLYANNNSEYGLALAYAAASNKAWWVEDDIYGFEKGSPEYNNAVAVMDAWFEIAEELEADIIAILRSEDVSIPETGIIHVLRPFMERNGFLDGCGWWIENDE